MTYLKINNLNAFYGKHHVLTDINLEINQGEVISLIGPSGSGKSTLLRTLIGLTKPKTGNVQLDGELIDYRKPESLKEARKQFAIVFQQFNLFQNMTVLENVTIAPHKIQKQDKKAVYDRAKALLEKVNLSDKLKCYPNQLSGGQQQRVALARALALQPNILLLDEVTSALDPELVSEVLDSIRVLAQEGMTMIIVSHQMSFVSEVSDRICFMADGKVIEVGPPEQVLKKPENDRTREFIGKIIRH